MSVLFEQDDGAVRVGGRTSKPYLASEPDLGTANQCRQVSYAGNQAKWGKRAKGKGKGGQAGSMGLDCLRSPFAGCFQRQQNGTCGLGVAGMALRPHLASCFDPGSGEDQVHRLERWIGWGREGARQQ